MPSNDWNNVPKFSFEAKMKLANMLLACVSMSTEMARDAVLAQLPREVTSRIGNAPNLQMQVFNLIDTCLSHRAMAKLLEVVRGFEGASVARARLDRTVVKVCSFLPNIISDDLFWKLDILLDREPLPFSSTALLEAYRRSARPSQRILMPTGADAELLDAILLRLADAVRRPDDGVYPILDFALLLAAQAHASLAGDLQAWANSAAKELQVAPIGAASPPVTAAPNLPDPYLLVKLKPTDPTQSQFEISAWIWRGRESVKRLYFDSAEKKVSTTISDMQGMPTVLKTLIGLAFIALDKNTTGMTIELFVPYQQISRDADRWPIPAGLNQNIGVGSKYPIVVRSYERIEGESQPWLRNAWLEKWNQFQALEATSDPIVWLSHQQDKKLQNIDDELGSANKVGLVSLVAPDDLPSFNNLSLIEKVLNAGMPIAFLLRKTADDPIVAKKACRDLLTAKQLTNLPRQLWDRRRQPDQTQAHLWCHVTLLWDDPTRLPPERDSDNRLATPLTIGQNQ